MDSQEESGVKRSLVLFLPRAGLPPIKNVEVISITQNRARYRARVTFENDEIKPIDVDGYFQDIP